MRKTATFLFSDGAQTPALDTDKDETLLEEVAAGLESTAPYIRLDLMENAAKGTTVVLKKEALLAVMLSPGKKKKKKKKVPQPVLPTDLEQPGDGVEEA